MTDRSKIGGLIESPECPRVSLALVEYLERLFPLRDPILEVSERKIFYDVGMREMIRWLRRKSEQQRSGG